MVLSKSAGVRRAAAPTWSAKVKVQPALSSIAGISFPVVFFRDFLSLLPMEQGKNKALSSSTNPGTGSTVPRKLQGKEQ